MGKCVAIAALLLFASGVCATAQCLRPPPGRGPARPAPTAVQPNHALPPQSHPAVDVPGEIVAVRWLDAAAPDDIWLLGPGPGRVNLTGDADVHENVCFAPDGTICFSRENPPAGQAAEIWRMADSGGAQEQLTFNSVTDYHPSVSPDGAKVVWWSYASGTPHLWIMDTGGSGPAVELITDPGVASFDPEFSPCGTMIAFNVSYDLGQTADIWIGVLNAARDAFLETWSLTNRGFVAAEVDPTWSPDGLQVAYSSYDGPGVWYVEGLDPALGLDWKIYTIDVDLANKTGVNWKVLIEDQTTPNAVSWLPCYSPDGTQIAFVRSGFDPGAWPGPFFFGTAWSELRVVNADGSGDRAIRGTKGCYWFDWR